MGGISYDDSASGSANNSGVGLNTTLPADPEQASGAMAAGPELGDANAGGSTGYPAGRRSKRRYVAEPTARTEVSTDPRHKQPILAKPGKEQP